MLPISDGTASLPPGAWLGLAASAAVAALLATIGTPLAIAAARSTGFMDKPGGALKTHRAPTPYLGGMAVFVPFMTAAALLFELDFEFLGVMLAATLAALLGLMDDFGAMRPGVKMAGQLIIVLVLLRAGVLIQIEGFPFQINAALTAIWMLAIINAVNFLDIVDGLAATACLIASGFFLVIAVLTGELAMACLSAALFGALAGYLPFSLPTARIFLGDCGSLFLGTLLGALALALDYSSATPWAIVAPVMILGVPAFEITFTVLVRIARRRAPWRGSPDHVALRLRRLGFSVPRLLAIVALASLMAGSLALWLVRAPGTLGPTIVGGGAVAAVAAAILLLRAPDPS